MGQQQIEIVASANTIGAEARGVDLAQPMSDETFHSIDSALNERAVLCFRQQHLTEPQYIDFARRFGAIERISLTHYAHPDYPEILFVSNSKENGRDIGMDTF